MFHSSSNCHYVCFLIICILIVISLSQASQLSHHSLTQSTGKRLRTKSLSNGTSAKPKFFIPTDLPINKEIKVYIFNEEVKRFTFTINTKLEAPLTLTVTPCSDPIKWSFEFVEDENAKELIGARKRRRHGKHNRQSHDERARRKRHRHELRQLSSESSRQTNLLLAKYNGVERRSFTDIRRQYSGQYVVQLSSNKRATSCTIILSHFNPYPLLPVNDTVSLVSLAPSNATIYWSSSLSEPDYPISYYVTLNQDHNLISFCEYLEQIDALTYHQLNNSSLKNENLLIKSRPVLPLFETDEDNLLDNEVLSSPSTPFIRWYERTMAKTWESEQARKNLNNQNIIHLEQVNKSTNEHIWKSLEPSTRYFVDVIAINRLTLATSLYKGINITTKEVPKMIPSLPVAPKVGPKKQKPDPMLPKLVRIRDKRLISVNLSRKNNFTEIFSYHYNESEFSIGSSLWLFIQLCSTLTLPKSVDVTINGASSTNDVMIRETGIRSSRVIHIPMGLKWYNSSIISSTNKNGQQLMIISLIGNSKFPFEVNLMMSKKRSHIPDPQLPRDRQIRVLDLLSTCTSVELAWIASPDDKALYCLYAAPITAEVTEHQIHQELNQLPEFNSNSSSTSACESLKMGKSMKGSKKQKAEFKKLMRSPRIVNALDKSKLFKRLQCRRFPRLTQSRLDQAIMHKINHLRPSTEYVFLIEIVKSSGLTGYYNPVTTATKSPKMC